MTFAQILATTSGLTEQDLADFASFMEPAEQERFWLDVEATHR